MTFTVTRACFFTLSFLLAFSPQFIKQALSLSLGICWIKSLLSLMVKWLSSSCLVPTLSPIHPYILPYPAKISPLFHNHILSPSLSQSYPLGHFPSLPPSLPTHRLSLLSKNSCKPESWRQGKMSVQSGPSTQHHYSLFFTHVGLVFFSPFPLVVSFPYLPCPSFSYCLLLISFS